ncbi:MAG: 16S rRNA (adenine(1518)-N(6)/adenine(1519)-N(6))-dimethyltransferase RsmA [Verrucomicrobiota bacterium]|nr:16S rRNA (adenine(1518)-N(6)/adenine(1519)-N(6))-dimethyltransferase RsmA [Verrucomicrobiota bacterium]
MNLSEIRKQLNDNDILLTRSLGQTFMHDRNQLRKIVGLATLNDADRVIEIGPGLGPLTELLLDTAGQVTAIETDLRLAKQLEERLGQRDNFTLQHADAMKLVRKAEFDWSGHKLVANLPYSIASPLLIDLAALAGRPSAMFVTLQLEVVQRLLAQPATKEYGVLTLLIGLHYASGESFVIPRGSFYPEPNVDSGCIELLRRQTPLLPPELCPVFKKIVKRVFAERRKKMMKLLKRDWAEATVTEAFNSLGLDESIRAERVTLDQFAELTQRLSRAEIDE